jgi:hypothetical protein
MLVVVPSDLHKPVGNRNVNENEVVIHECTNTNTKENNTIRAKNADLEMDIKQAKRGTASYRDALIRSDYS